ncbi:hypothetical protein PXD04_10350 [Methanosphaera sp. ISO3-F5]|uniref:hypothetical protein n=1 Tax=Methanosphaera sp. ISO3-F5 TaxID=1452353 RepID=UPI002B25B41B|nr:hypothetical protein [Methanosphaera sp. ISO3-F5]WQH64091.1 phage portal protein [Methanosphaera sp. ISO3-F5]
MSESIPELLDVKPTVTYKEDVEPVPINEVGADSFIVTSDNEGNLYSREKGVFKSYYDSTDSFSESAQRGENYHGVKYKTPAYPSSFLTFLSRNNWVFRQCAERVANDCIKNGFDIVSRSGLEDDSDIEAKQELLDWFNRMPVPITEVIHDVIYTYEISGRAGVEIIREDTLDSPMQYLKNFDIVNAKLCSDGKRVVQTINGEDTFFILYNTNKENGQTRYLNRYTGEWSNTSFGKDNDAHEVLWYYRYDLGANEYGVPLIAPGLRIVEMERGRENYIIDFFVNFGMPAWIVSITGQFYDEENRRYLPDGSLNPNFDVTKTIRYKIGQQIQEIIDGGHHGAIVMSFPTTSGQDPVKVDIVPLAVDVKEASFRGLREDNKKDLCGMMGVDVQLIGEVENGAMGNNAMDSLLLQHNDNKIKPTQSTITTPLSKLLLFENKTTFKHDISNVRFKLLDFIEQNITENVSRDADLVLKGLMKPREFQNKYSKALGITSDSEEPLLDEYCLNGVPLGVVAEKGAITELNVNALSNQVLKEGRAFERKQENILQAKKYASKGRLSVIKEAILGHR